MVSIMGLHTIHNKIIPDLWDSSQKTTMKCPHCDQELHVESIDEIDSFNTPFIPYETILKCSSCTFESTSQSYALRGSIQDFDLHNITITGWSPSGSRVVSKLDHVMDFSLLKTLQKSEEIVEFLVVDNQVVRCIK